MFSHIFKGVFLTPFGSHPPNFSVIYIYIYIYIYQINEYNIVYSIPLAIQPLSPSKHRTQAPSPAFRRVNDQNIALLLVTAEWAGAVTPDGLMLLKYVYIYIYVCTCICICIYVYICICICICIHIKLYIYV